MKLVRYGKRNQEKPGLIDSAGKLRDLSDVIPDITSANLSPSALAKLKALDTSKLLEVKGSVRYGVPVADIKKCLCIGLNFSDHAAESNLPIPKEPIIFNKWINCLGGANDPIVKPKKSVKTDWEVELGVVIGQKARYVSLGDALNYVAGYCVVNDVSEREYQTERGGTWDKGKGCDTFGPVGPWLVTADEVGDPQNLKMWLEVNGKKMQTGHTSTMIFNIAYLIHYVSQFATLYPGDLISTGTPPGVGMGMKPPQYLQAGDVVRLGIEKLGEQEQKIYDWNADLLD